MILSQIIPSTFPFFLYLVASSPPFCTSWRPSTSRSSHRGDLFSYFFFLQLFSLLLVFLAASQTLLHLFSGLSKQFSTSFSISTFLVHLAFSFHLYEVCKSVSRTMQPTTPTSLPITILFFNYKHVISVGFPSHSFQPAGALALLIVLSCSLGMLK